MLGSTVAFVDRRGATCQGEIVVFRFQEALRVIRIRWAYFAEHVVIHQYAVPVLTGRPAVFDETGERAFECRLGVIRRHLMVGEFQPKLAVG